MERSFSLFALIMNAAQSVFPDKAFESIFYLRLQKLLIQTLSVALHFERISLKSYWARVFLLFVLYIDSVHPIFSPQAFKSIVISYDFEKRSLYLSILRELFLNHSVCGLRE